MSVSINDSCITEATHASTSQLGKMKNITFGGADVAAVSGLEVLICGARGAITYAAVSCSTFMTDLVFHFSA